MVASVDPPKLICGFSRDDLEGFGGRWMYVARKCVSSAAGLEDAFQRKPATTIVVRKGDDPRPLAGHRIVEPLVGLGDRHRRIERQVSDPSPFSNSDAETGQSVIRNSRAKSRNAARVAG